MARKISKRKQPEREVKPIKERMKIYSSKVLDDKVLEILNWMMNTRKIDSFDFPISSGKEAVVFRATRLKPDGAPEHVAVKVFKYETSMFKTMLQYIEGDRKFDPRKNKRLLVNDWARKEYSNLQLCHRAGVRVPEPYYLRVNVIVMEFLGEGGFQSALMEQVVLADPQATYDDVVENMRKTFDAGLIHADLSSFNIIIHKGLPYLIDWAQGVERNHPHAEMFLQKDCTNIADFFSKLGVKTSADEIYAKVTVNRKEDDRQGRRR
jgi:RIO kinase 1